MQNKIRPLFCIHSISGVIPKKTPLIAQYHDYHVILLRTFQRDLRFLLPIFLLRLGLAMHFSS